jgi:hypothetical protein
MMRMFHTQVVSRTSSCQEFPWREVRVEVAAARGHIPRGLERVAGRLQGPLFALWTLLLRRQPMESVPPPQDSFSFYKRVFEYIHAHGGVGYEVDFMSNLFIDIPGILDQ